MFVRSFAFKDSSPNGWVFEPFTLESSNLLVGLSGSGKSRFISTLWAYANYQVNNQPQLLQSPTQIPISGDWTITLKDGSDTYEINFKTEPAEIPGHIPDIASETIIRHSKGLDPKELVRRTKDGFYFSESLLPKLPRNLAAIYLLRDEAAIKPLYSCLLHLMRRDFHGAVLSVMTGYQGLAPVGRTQVERAASLEDIFAAALTLPTKMHLIEKHFLKEFKEIKELFKSVFPTIEDLVIKPIETNVAGQFGVPIPYLYVKEKGIDKLIRIDEMSSGMIKSLLIISDVVTLPSPTIYIIDEYENSLGINAIDFLPRLLIDYADRAQFIVTTHHPYLINQIPINYWRVFTRKHSTISVKDGSILGDRYGKSKQQQFVQLMNDLSKGTL